MTLTQADNELDPWRHRLGRRLAHLTMVLTIVVFFPIAVATSDDMARIALLSTAGLVVLGLGLISRETTPPNVRSIGVITVFVAIGTVGYATFGFLSGPGVGFAAAVSFAGLLLGRRAFYITSIICTLAGGVIALLMVNGVLPAPAAEEISPLVGPAWIRSGAITFVLITILGAAVTGVVESIEAALARVALESKGRREAESQVLQAHSTQLIGQLAASLAHDVNNQLTVISWWSERATADTSEDERREAQTAVSQSIDQAASLTKQMLMLGRRDAPRPQVVHMATFFDKNTTMIQTVAQGDIETVVQADSDASCEIDPSRLGQVLLNLAVNARHAMTGGGTLTIEARRRRGAGGTGLGGPIPKADWMVLSVEDTGVGMDEETQRRAFEPFFTTKRIGEGTGLGLATVAVIVDQAAGHLTLHSEPGHGTRIELWLPATEGATTPEAQPPTAGSTIGPIRVLLAEDSIAVLEVARRALADAGATVITAETGDAALTLIERGHFDVLCTDVVMPGAPSSELIDIFRARNPTSAVLLCSGYVGEDLVRRGIEDGRYQLLQKPYTADSLVSAVGTLWSEALSRAEALRSELQ